MVSLLSKVEEQYDIKITFSVETEPLGTGAFSFPSHPSGSSCETDGGMPIREVGADE
jgi:hypothetical protein